jgi:hypothetical protein
MGGNSIWVTLSACGVLAMGCSSGEDGPDSQPSMPPPQSTLPIVGGAGGATGMVAVPGGGGAPVMPMNTGAGAASIPMTSAGSGAPAMMGTAGMPMGTAGAPATAGGGSETPVDPAMRTAPCITKGSQVAVIGDSYIEYTFPLVPLLEQKAVAEGALMQGDHYNNQALPGSSLAVGLLLIEPQWREAKRSSMNDVKFVVMDGGGNDVLLYNQQCLVDGSSKDPYCQMVADNASDVADELMQDMKATGVSDVLFFFYPHVPAGGQDLMDNYAGPQAKRRCEEGSDATFRCHFVSLIETFEGHADYIQADGIHPTAAGAAAQATLIWGEMKKHCMAQTGGCCM